MRLNGPAISVRPVEPRSGEQLDLVAIDPRVHAVAVVLDLVRPVRALGRLIGETR